MFHLMGIMMQSLKALCLQSLLLLLMRMMMVKHLLLLISVSASFVEHWFFHGREFRRRIITWLVHVGGNIGRRRSWGNSYPNLALEVGCDPTKPNCVELFHALIRELRFEATQSQRVFATLFHDPTSKGFILRIILRDIDVSIMLLGVFQQLLVTIFPSSDGSCHSPLETK